MKILKKTLPYQDQQTHALMFLPEGEVEHWAFITHGYTAHKGSVLNWASRLAEINFAVVLFDLPGHYLGNYSEVTDLDHFVIHGHELFLEAYKLLQNELGTTCESLFTLGHSLGALMAMKALEIEELKDAVTIGVGFGHFSGAEGEVHFFLTPIFEKTLLVRSQIVSAALDPHKVFARIKEEKEKLNIKGKRIHLITGEDDVVTRGKQGIENLAELLTKRGNTVTHETFHRLPHHMPEMATGHIYAFLKKFFSNKI